MSREPRIKGTGIRGTLQALAELRGPDALEGVLSTLPTELARVMRHGPIVASSWYPLAHYRDLLRGIERTQPGGRHLIRELGRVSVSRDLGTTYRTFLRLFPTDRVFQISTRFFNSYYDVGEAHLEERRRGYVRCHWSNCTGFDANLWTDVLGGAQGILEAMGAENLRVHAKQGGGDDEDFLVAEGFWH